MNTPKGHKPETCGCNVCRKWRRLKQDGAPLPEKLAAKRDDKAIVKVLDASDAEALQEFLLEANPQRDRKAALAYYFLRRLEDPTLEDSAIAAELGLKQYTLSAYRNRAIKEGWFKYTDTVQKLQNEALPKALDTLIHHIENKNLDAALATIRGMGHFRNYQAIQQKEAPTQARLEISLDIPERIEESTNIVGAPKVIDVETVEETND